MGSRGGDCPNKDRSEQRSSRQTDGIRHQSISQRIPSRRCQGAPIVRAAIALTTSLLTACGGGGGDSDEQFVGAALVNIDAVPRETDPGKRVRVMARINEVHRDGVFVKIRFPDGFSYAPATSRFLYRDTERAVDPQFNVAATKEGSVYLVFNLARSLFGEDNEGMLILELNADSGVQSGSIEIDADVNDPTVPDQSEFSVENSEFDAQDDVEIEVRG